MSRLVTYGAACSLDGFIARADGAVDWLHYSKDAKKIMGEYWPGVDVILMGRKTWDVAVAMGGGGGPSDAKMKTIVFSRTLAADGAPGAEVVSSEPGAFVRALKEEEGGKICLMGGGELAASMFTAGVVDEVGLNVHPVLLGSGIPLFRDPGRQTDLELTECRQIDGGCVYLNYRVRGSSV